MRRPDKGLEASESASEADEEAARGRPSEAAVSRSAFGGSLSQRGASASFNPRLQLQFQSHSIRALRTY